MSKFRKLAQHIEALGAEVDGWEGADACPAGGEVRRVARALVEAGEELSKFVARARETDSDKKVYGEKMVSRVLALNEQWERWTAHAEAASAALPDEASGDDAAASGRNEVLLRSEEEIARIERERAGREAKRAAVEAEEERLRKERERRRAEEEERVREREREVEERNRKLEQEVAEREAARAAELAAEEARLARLAEAEGRSAEEGVELLRSRVDGAAFRRIVAALAAIVGGIAEEPADPARRHLRATNEALRRDVTGSVEGEEALVAVGFRLRELRRPLPGTYYVYPEADTADADRWMEWFEGVQRLADALRRVHQSA